MNITKDKVASIHYTLKSDKGEVLDSSEGKDPLSYLQGHGNLIPGLEKELEGKAQGDKLAVVIPPEEAYGTYKEALVQQVPMSNFQDPAQVAIGVQFQIQFTDSVQIATVTKIEGDQVTIDMNHPLADQELHFDVEIMSVREASQTELEHGHVHHGDH